MKTVTIALWAIALLTSFATDPAFVTSDPNGGWSEAGYYVHNNMWNRAHYSPCTSTLLAWSHDRWRVVTRMNNRTGDGAVKTYPNVHRDYRSVPVSSFESLTSTFAQRSPRSGIYNFAYDLWINGIARPGCTEIMIWTENLGQVPGGRFVEDVVFDGRTYRVYRRSDNYIAFVATADSTFGTLNLLDILKWVVGKGWLADKSTLHQICYGVEVVSTDDEEATFEVTSFSIEAKSKPSLDIQTPATTATPASRLGSSDAQTPQ